MISFKTKGVPEIINKFDNLQLQINRVPKREIQKVLDRAKIIAQKHTPIDTGILRSAHETRIERQGFRVIGKLYLNPNKFNPKSQQYAHKYGVIVHNRSDETAFYDKTANELIIPEAPRLLNRIKNFITRIF